MCEYYKVYQNKPDKIYHSDLFHKKMCEYNYFIFFLN